MPLYSPGTSPSQLHSSANRLVKELVMSERVRLPHIADTPTLAALAQPSRPSVQSQQLQPPMGAGHAAELRRQQMLRFARAH